MSGAKYPRFRLSQWIDTSPEAMELEQARILYGIQRQGAKGERWLHCRKGQEPILSESAAEITALLAELRKEGAAP